jgi:predicted nucleotidyltransferase
MHLPDAIRILKDNEAALKKLGVAHRYVFGSTARGDQSPESDVDLFFEDDGALSLFDVMDIQEAASAFLGCTADVMTRDSINRYIRPFAQAEAVAVF